MENDYLAGYMMKRLLVVFFLLVYGICGAQVTGSRHLVRLGWGDPLFEKLVFYPSAGTSSYSYSGHFFADYHYTLTPVVSVGGQADFQSVCWTEKSGTRSRNYDFSIMPTVRFSWLRKEWVRLYSGMGLGMLVAWDNAGGKALAPVINLNPVGVQVGNGPWCGSLDLGFMASLRDANHIFLLGSRLISVGVNYRW